MIKFSINKILTLIVVYLSIQLYSHAEIIKKIEVDGNNRVNTETIKIFSGVKKNDNLSSDDLNEVLKKASSFRLPVNIKVLLNLCK